MAYTLLEMMDGRWLEGDVLRNKKYSNTFIKDLALLLNELHQYPFSIQYSDQYPSPMFNIIRNFRPMYQWSCGRSYYKDKHIRKFIKDTVLEFREIESELTGEVLLHGDLYGKNIIVTPDGNFQGLIDWKNQSIGDPHWEFRTIRRNIGWHGLEELLSFYNGNCNLEYIKVLDKIALCHSLQLRQNLMSRFDSLKPDWNPASMHGSPDTIAVYEEYIRKWPDNIYW